MDRRQKKSRDAIFNAFGELLSYKSYDRITVQEIIDRADIGRSTFYAHFETKDALLQELCRELFGHIIDTALDRVHTHGRYSQGKAPASVFLHLLQHLRENDRNVLGLLGCENSGLFLGYFRESLKDLVRTQAANTSFHVPDEFWVNHVCGSFVEMVLWWIKGGLAYPPEELEGFFREVIGFEE